MFEHEKNPNSLSFVSSFFNQCLGEANDMINVKVKDGEASVCEAEAAAMEGVEEEQSKMEGMASVALLPNGLIEKINGEKPKKQPFIGLKTECIEATKPTGYCGRTWMENAALMLSRAIYFSMWFDSLVYYCSRLQAIHNHRMFVKVDGILLASAQLWIKHVKTIGASYY
ncbi:hypothetical protein L1987_51265 [Smallanthus sonchifolius]|uniref:Uncharacterized protein n=1 Tax=Smallanthus sonchifolius TaxID=185202 RepID=A0ACB9EQG9_9ASTR|nr:hypothetical protein L1987_51265 [Smallanthus sonchifolius]